MRMGQGVRTRFGHGGITCVLQTQFSSSFLFQRKRSSFLYPPLKREKKSYCICNRPDDGRYKVYFCLINSNAFLFGVLGELEKKNRKQQASDHFF